jgi:ligand-binding sensor domain-containing protein
MGVVLIIVLFLFKETGTIESRSVTFDPDSCVRLIDIGRVFRIRTQDTDSNMLWFCTAAGLWRLDEETLAWTRFGLDHGLASETIVDAAFRDGEVWVATWNGAARYDSVHNRFIPLDFVPGMGASRILAVEFLSDELYLSIDGRGLYRLADTMSQPAPVDIPGVKRSARITCLRAVDTTLYAGVEGRRVFVRRTDGEFDEMAFSRPGGEETLVWDILVHRGGLWAATSNDGLWRADNGADTLALVDEFPAKGAYALSPETDGVWCGTPFGLWRYHANEDVWIQFVHPEENSPTDFQVFTLANTPEALWYGSMDLGAGFFRKERVDWQPMRAGLSMPGVAAVIADSQTLWTAYGYQGGYIDRFDAQAVQYDRNYNYVNGIIDPHIQSFAFRGDRLYYGGYASFGYVNPRTRSYRHFQGDSSLPYADIADIECSGDSLVYLAGLFGLLLFDPAAERFAPTPATSGMRVTAVRETGDRIYFGVLGRGVYALEKRSGTLVDSILSGTRRIMDISGPDEDGCLWIAAKQRGVYRYLPDTGELRAYAPPADSDQGSGGAGDVFAARYVDGYYWLGTRSRGCVILDTRNEAWHTLTYWSGLVSDKVRSFWDTERYVWVGCQGGVNRYDKAYLYNQFAADDASSARARSASSREPNHKRRAREAL